MKPELRVSVLSDYVCPFCYIGHKRLEKLRDEFDLKIQWCLLEIHPDTPPEGRPVTQLGYSPQHWQQLMQNLQRLANEDNIPLGEHRLTCNSRKALLLAEASKTLGAETFYGLHNALFEALFIHQRNIGDEAVLRELAARQGISENLVIRAWQTAHANGPASETPAPLLPYLQYAGALQARSVPTFVFGSHVLNGVVDTSRLRETARQVLGN